MITKAKKKHTGDFKQRVGLFENTQVDDGMGGTIPSESKITDLWANIKPVSGSEKWEIESLKGNISHVIHIRLYEGITNENWFGFNGNKYFVKYVLNLDYENHYMEIAATEEV